MDLLRNEVTRRGALSTGVISLVGGAFPTFGITERGDDETLIYHEMKVIGKLDSDQYEGLWKNMSGITAQELDWKMHPEANTVRWIIGHLTWFDEWIADAVNETGMYLDSSRGPESFYEPSWEKMKERSNRAREAYNQIADQLKPGDLKRNLRFVPNKLGQRYDIPLHALMLDVHPMHLAGHRYQIRFLRGTYSRHNKTDKTKFDEY